MQNSPTITAPAFDLSKVNVGTNGMVQTGLGSFVNKDSLDENGYKQAVNYQATKDTSVAPPVNNSVIQTSTSQRAETQSRLQDMNTKITSGNVASGGSATVTDPNAANGNTTGTDTTGTGGADTTKNADGSTKTTGTTTKTDQPDDFMASIKDTMDGLKSAAATQIATVHTNLESLKAYTDTATQNLISGIQGMYQSRIASVQDSYNRLGASKAEDGFRTGLTRYASGQEAGVLTDNEVQGQMAVAKLQAEMMETIGKAQSAQSDSDLKTFNDEYDKIDAINKEMNSQVTALYKQAVDKQNADLKAAQDNITNGMKATTQGLDVSKRAAPSLAASLSGLTTDEQKADLINNFAKANNIDPSVVWSDMQGAMTTQQKADLDIENIKSQIAARANSGASGTKITLASAKAKGLPLSVVGQSEAGIVASLYSDQVPKWFEDKANQQAQVSLTPEALSSLWSKSRTAYISSLQKDAAGSASSTPDGGATSTPDDTSGDGNLFGN